MYPYLKKVHVYSFKKDVNLLIFPTLIPELNLFGTENCWAQISWLTISAQLFFSQPDPADPAAPTVKGKFLGSLFGENNFQDVTPFFVEILIYDRIVTHWLASQ